MHVVAKRRNISKSRAVIPHSASRLGYGLDGVLGFDSRRRLGIFLFTIASSTAGIKRPGREADHSPQSGAEVKQ
jgi:hypothetical protein